MGTGLLTMVWLLLAPAAGAPGVSNMMQRNFKIPIHIDPARRDHIKELILLSSTDQGKSWHHEATVTADKDAFTYYAPNDGLYWFSVTVVDKNGKRDPEDPAQSSEVLKVLVDSTKPEVHLWTERQGDDITARWEVREENPEWASLKMEYRLVDVPGGAWNVVPLTAGPTGQATFRPSSWAHVAVRLQMQDSAGNFGTVSSEVVAAPGAEHQAHGRRRAAGPGPSAIRLGVRVSGTARSGGCAIGL